MARPPGAGLANQGAGTTAPAVADDSRSRHTGSQLAALVPAARPADVSSPEAIVGAAYDFISGPQGPRKWDRFRSLCLPTARLGRAEVGEDGKAYVVDWSLDEFIAYADPVLSKTDFYETGLVNRVHRFGSMAEVFSSYETRSEKNSKPLERGMTS
jgi:hypothetical protein